MENDMLCDYHVVKISGSFHMEQNRFNIILLNVQANTCTYSKKY